MASSRPHPWLPLLALLLQLVLVGTGCWLIDASDLDQGLESWGFVFGFVVGAIFYASWPVVVALVCAVAGATASSATGARRAALVGAVVAAAWGVLGIVVGAQSALSGIHEAEVVFGVLLLGTSLLPLWPLTRTVLVARART